MRACTHNVLLVNQISCSRGKERFVCIGSHLFQNSLRRCASACMHESTQEKNKE